MGDQFPRVTEILRAVGLGPDFSSVPRAALEAARDRGSRVHALIESDHYGFIEQAAIDAACAPYYLAYRKFLAESQHEALASEVEVVHPAWRYVGHIDRVGWISGYRAILDWKAVETVDVLAASCQLSGYRLAWNAMHPEAPAVCTAVVQLRADGSYRYHDINARDFDQVFLAAVTIFRAQQERAA